VARLAPDRVATFAFAYVPDAKPHQRRLPLAELPVGRARLELLGVAQEGFAAAGYLPIGIDHFARPDDDLARAAARGTLGRDFQGYTACAAGETVAFGPSAISDVGGAYAQNQRHPDAWERALRGGRLATARGHRLDDDDRRRRALIASLMCNFTAQVGPEFAREREALAPLARDGLLTLDGSALALTPLGRLFARNVAMLFDAYLRRGEGAVSFSRAV
jgi:oxygen-independent coproporphyrinogen-3 oxidase